MKQIYTYILRIIILLTSLFFAVENIRYGKEGIGECRTLQKEISVLKNKKNKLESMIATFDKELSYLADSEFQTEQALRKNLLKNKNEVLYLI